MEVNGRTPLLRLVLWSAAFVVAGYVGRATIIDGRAMSLVWPAAGVGALWLCSSTRRTRVADSMALVGCTVLVNATTGASAQLALVFAAANLLQGWAFVAVVRRMLPDVRGVVPASAGRTLRPVGRVADLGGLVTAAVLACSLAASAGWAGLSWVVGSSDVVSLLLWWGRNTAGALVVVTFGLLLVARLAQRPEGTTRHRLAGVVRQAWRTHGAETVAIYGLTAVVVVGVFVVARDEPLSFVLLFPTLLAGARLSALATIWHSLLMGGVMVAFTIAGVGPFAPVESLEIRALLAQGFVALIVVAGLVLAFSHSERDEAMQRVARSERAAEDRAALLGAVVDSMREGLVVTSRDGTVLVRNDASAQMVGLAPSSVVREAAHYGLVDADGRPLAEDQMPYRRALAGEDLHGEDLHFVDPEGRRRVLEIDAVRLPADDAAHDRAVVTFRDVTDVRTERDTLAAFAGVVAHDLLNPLTVVRGWADSLDDAFLEGPVETADGRAMLARISSSTDRMEQFIGDLLAYTVARDSAIALAHVDLSSLAEDVAALRREGSTRPVIRVQSAMTAYGDAVLLRQLLDNLIGNAVKYVAPGVRPVVDVSAVVVDGRIELAVSDNGIGVPLAARDLIFESFQRAHPDDYKGTGIGLAICRQVVDRHGGSIRVEDRETGTGSRFTVSLPAAA